MTTLAVVIPAKAGISIFKYFEIPAFAGMTKINARTTKIKAGMTKIKLTSLQTYLRTSYTPRSMT